jgi:hypothetical protein
MMANALKLFFAEKAKERQGAQTDLKAKANIPRDPAEGLLGERREASGQAAAAVVASRDSAEGGKDPGGRAGLGGSSRGGRAVDVRHSQPRDLRGPEPRGIGRGQRRQERGRWAGGSPPKWARH